MEIALELLFVIALLTSPVWVFALGFAWLKSAEDSMKKDLQDRLDAASADGKFTPTKTFGWRKSLIAFDAERRLVFLADHNTGPMRSKVYPMSALFKYKSGAVFHGKTPMYYVDLSVHDLENPLWRIWFGKKDDEIPPLTSVLEIMWRQEAA